MTDFASAHTEARSSRVVDPSDERWRRLLAQIQKDSLQIGDFTLSSGRKSRFIFQLRQTTLHPEGAYLSAEIIVDYMRTQGLRFIGGLVLGAVPIVASVAAVSQSRGAPVFAFFVRKEAKGHGSREIIDGYTGEGEGEEILLVDDVATTGGSILKALAILKEEGFKGSVKKALVVIDREEGGAENLAREGIALVSIFKKSDFDIGV
ncbi:orotate phosphoribosyltransferase [Methylocystis bryophila]|uniref:orotate phosphoribosyltransferase n=1 Tax=Methylocystis bryophila TaxID=655015 RepID=UPI001FD8B3B0|nr:orotate phosphoribosyltransferase [Methylocystis bryophila]BDV37764.1 orotate phosphoribosyltransferase [Methylocystis bryophila]